MQVDTNSLSNDYLKILITYFLQYSIDNELIHSYQTISRNFCLLYFKLTEKSYRGIYYLNYL